LAESVWISAKAQHFPDHLVLGGFRVKLQCADRVLENRIAELICAIQVKSLCHLKPDGVEIASARGRHEDLDLAVDISRSLFMVFHYTSLVLEVESPFRAPLRGHAARHHW